jgi:hypothetical protein
MKFVKAAIALGCTVGTLQRPSQKPVLVVVLPEM